MESLGFSALNEGKEDKICVWRRSDKCGISNLDFFEQQRASTPPPRLRALEMTGGFKKKKKKITYLYRQFLNAEELQKGGQKITF